MSWAFGLSIGEVIASLVVGVVAALCLPVLETVFWWLRLPKLEAEEELALALRRLDADKSESSHRTAAVALENDLDVEVQGFGTSSPINYLRSYIAQEGLFLVFPNVVLTNRTSSNMVLMVSLHIPLAENSPTGSSELVPRTEKREQLMQIVRSNFPMSARQMLIMPISVQPHSAADGVIVFCIKPSILSMFPGTSDTWELYTENGPWHLRIEEKVSGRVMTVDVEPNATL